VKSSFDVGAKRSSFCSYGSQNHKENCSTAEKTALKPIATGSLPKINDFEADYLPELPTYKPPRELKFKASKLLTTDLTELQTFQSPSPFEMRLRRPSLILRTSTSNHRNHRAMPLANQNAQNHHWEQFPKRGYCVWCKKQAETSKTRLVFAEIVNGATSTGRKRSTRSSRGCTGCNVNLYKKEACFEQYHSNSNSK
jgi:hypothetical protein